MEVLAGEKIPTTFHALERSQGANSTSSDFISELPKIMKKIVHQCSTPNLNSTELDRVSEKYRDKLSHSERETSKSTGILPRTVKLYKLLATQSEENGEFHLVNRTPFHISEYGEKIDVISKQDEQKLSHAESAPVLEITDFADSGLRNFPPTVRSISPCRKLYTPNISDPSFITVRPIYPYCPYSPYGSPQGSPTIGRRPLRESRRVSIDKRHGALQLNQYKLLDNIGQGSYGIVKLVFNEEDETYYAMKILSKKKLMKKAGIFGRMIPGRNSTLTPLAKVYREIALLKKLDHPNVVKLVEVLDDPDEDNLYLVFELVQKGEVLQIPTKKPIEEETARKNFRDVILGVEYLHYQRIVHRDIKPSNLLVDGEGRVKIADLGVSAELRTIGELLTGLAGTPAFAAPETTVPGAHYSGSPCDIWSLGATLYSLVTGRVPWDGAGSIIGVQSAVRMESLRFPETPVLSRELRELISLMLAKDPDKRISLSQIKEHRWLTSNGNEPLPSETDNCRLPVTVTDEEAESVVTRVPKLDTLILIKAMLKQHSFQNPFLTGKFIRSMFNYADFESPEIAYEANDGSSRLIEPRRKTKQFHESGRSNSAPDSYDLQGSVRQGSTESLLPPLTEALIQETKKEKV